MKQVDMDESVVERDFDYEALKKLNTGKKGNKLKNNLIIGSAIVMAAAGVAYDKLYMSNETQKVEQPTFITSALNTFNAEEGEGQNEGSVTNPQDQTIQDNTAEDSGRVTQVETQLVPQNQTLTVVPAPVTSVNDRIDLLSINTDLSAIEVQRDFEDSNAVTIRPPEDVQTATNENNVNTERLEKRITELEARDQHRINIVKTSQELQQLALGRLTALLTKLDDLNKDLDSLSKHTSEQAKPKTVIPKKTVSAEHVTPAKKVTARPLKKANISDEAVLIGTDLWGGERFAQINYKGKIYLLAINEYLEDWEVVSVTSRKVTLRGKEGEYELTKE